MKPWTGKTFVRKENAHFNVAAIDAIKIVYVEAGRLIIQTATEAKIVPPGRLVYVKNKTPHSISLESGTLGWITYLPASLSLDSKTTISVIHSTQLLVDLLQRLSEAKELNKSKSDAALKTLIMSEFSVARLEQIALPIPKTRELQKIAADIRYGLVGKISVTEVAKKTFMSERTFARKFKSETGFTFELWRNMALLQLATELLADGVDVSDTAEKIGFESVSAFIASFKKEFRTTPKQYAKSAVA